MKLWLDDMRPAPDGWTLANNINDAKRFLTPGAVEELSLDHDLGSPSCDYPSPEFSFCWNSQGRNCGNLCPCQCHENYENGYDLVKWMVENDVWPKKAIYIHSGNPVGRQNMKALIQRYAPEKLVQNL